MKILNKQILLALLISLPSFSGLTELSEDLVEISQTAKRTSVSDDTAANIICLNKNTDQFSEIESFTQQMAPITDDVDISIDLTTQQVANLCNAIRQSHSGTNPSTTYYRYEELLMDYISVDVNDENAPVEIKTYLHANYKAITCKARLPYPEGGLLIQLAAAMFNSALSSFVSLYEFDHLTLEDSKGQKVVPWLENEISESTSERVTAEHTNTLRILKDLENEDDFLNF
jgi:hypothetical protein